MCRYYVDEMPSQAQEPGAIMSRARLPRESAQLGRMRMHDGSSWLSLYGDDHEASSSVFMAPHVGAMSMCEHV